MRIGFDGKVVLITGAGSGLGRAYALEFARRGASVIVNDVGACTLGKGRSDIAAEVLKEVEDLGGNGIACHADITKREEVDDTIAKIMDRYGRIDILVNNAGFSRDVSFGNLTAEDCLPVLDVHLVGSIRVTRRVWPVMMRQAYGRILVTTSASGLYGTSGQASYSAAKMGVIGLINTLKLEGGKFNIRSNAIAPVAYTRATETLYPPEAEALMTPEQVAAGVMFLCSEQAPNGAILCAGAGGFTKAEIRESQGVFLKPEKTSPEVIARNWEKISDMTNDRTHETGADQLGKFFAMAKR